MFFIIKILMVASNHLFNLIKSLNKSEKRYFKLYTGLQEGNKNYLDLFNAIEKQDIYDEGKIKKQLKNHPVASRLAIEKFNLYELILKCLRNYHASHHGVDMTLRNTLTDIDILYEKNLLIECERKIKQAKKIASNADKPEFMAEIMRKEIEISGRKRVFNRKELNEKFKSLYEQLNSYKNNINYLKLASEINTLMLVEGKVNTPKHIMAEAKKIITHPSFKLNDISLFGRYYRFNSNIIYSFAKGNYDQTFNEMLAYLNFFDLHPVFKQERELSYARLLSNIAGFYIEKEKPNEALKMIERLKEHKFKARLAINEAQFNIFAYTIYYHILLVQYNDIQKHIRSQKHIIEKYTVSLEQEKSITLFYLLGLSCFCTGNYRLANKWFYEIFNNDWTVRQDIQINAYLLSIICHFELGNSELMIKALHKAQRLITITHRESKIYNEFFGYITLLNNKGEVKLNRKKIFIDLSSELERYIKSINNNRKEIIYELILNWCDASIKGVTFEQIAFWRKENRTIVN